MSRRAVTHRWIRLAPAPPAGGAAAALHRFRNVIRAASVAACMLLLLPGALYAQPTPAPVGAASIDKLPNNLLHDALALPSWSSLWWTLGGAAATASALPFDDDVTHEIAKIQSGTLRRVFIPGKFLGETAVEVGVAGATYGVGRLGHQRETEAAGLELVRADLLTEALVEALKFSTRRERPDRSNRRSFPSGHSAMMFATATVLARRFGWAPTLPAYLVAAYVAASRVDTDRHYVSDVIAGAFLGTIVARTVTRPGANPAIAAARHQPRGQQFVLTWSVPLGSFR